MNDKDKKEFDVTLINSCVTYWYMNTRKIDCTKV